MPFLWNEWLEVQENISADVAASEALGKKKARNHEYEGAQVHNS